MKPPAFISYARADAEFALRLAADLKAKGANVWLDQLDVKPGQKWDREIERALTSCAEMVIILSPSSVESENVMDEVSFALRKGKAVIPVMHRDCEVPFRLARLQYIAMTPVYERALKALLTALAVEQLESAAAAAVAAIEERPIAISPIESKPPATPTEPVSEPPQSGSPLPRMEAQGVENVFERDSGWWRARWRTILHSRRGLVAAGSVLLCLSGVTFGVIQWAKANMRRAGPITIAAAAHTPHVGETKINPKDGLTYVWIPPGEFTMGCSRGDNECYDDEKPPHQVTLTTGFWMGQTPVTQAAYERVTRGRGATAARTVGHGQHFCTPTRHYIECSSQRPGDGLGAEPRSYRCLCTCSSSDALSPILCLNPGPLPPSRCVKRNQIQ